MDEILLVECCWIVRNEMQCAELQVWVKYDSDVKTLVNVCLLAGGSDIMIFKENTLSQKRKSPQALILVY